MSNYEEMRARVRIMVLGVAVFFTGVAIGLWMTHQDWTTVHHEPVVVEVIKEVIVPVPMEHEHPCFYGVVTITEDLELGGSRSIIGDGEVCGEWGRTTGPSKLYPYRFDYPQEGENR